MGATKVLSITGVTVVAGILGIGLMAGGIKTPEERAAYALKKMAKAADSMTGQQVHPNVVFDGYDIVDNSFTYHYTLTHITDGRYNGVDKVRIQRQMHQKVCSDRGLKRLLKGDGVVRYSYKDKGGNHLFIIGFDDAICGLAS